MTAFGVHSEVGKLRKVIVHRPDLSLKRLTPANHDDLLFDDVLWVEQAQREHDAFVEILRSRGVEVYYTQELLSETLAASNEARGKLVDAVASPYTVGWSVADEIRQYLMTLDPTKLAEHLIGGMTAAEADLDWKSLGKVSLTAAALDDQETFVLPPLPNSLFSRDSSVPPDVSGSRIQLVVPGTGRAGTLRRVRLRACLDGRWRRPADRQRRCPDRHE
jgi:arginine deiminase